MKIRIDVLEGDYSPAALAVSERNELTSRTTTTLIGDQESILRGLSLLNDGTVVAEFIDSSSLHTKPGNQTLENMIFHSWTVAHIGRANKINEA